MNNHRNSGAYRIINCCILIAFISTSVFMPVPRAAHAMNAPLPISDSARGALDVSKLIVPENYGVVSERHRAQNTPHASQTFIIVQDSHANFEAQSNICKIIESLVMLAKVPVGTIFVEGGKGVLRADTLRPEASDDVRKMVARYLLKLGYLAGTEYYAITSKTNPSPLIGIEDRDLYYQNLAAFQKTYAVRDANLRIIADIKKMLLLIRSKVCSPALQKLLENDEQYAAGVIPFVDFCSYLVRTGKGLHIEYSHFPNVAYAFQSIELEKMISVKKVDAQKEALISKISKIAVKEEMAQLVEKSLLYRTGRILSHDFYAYLVNLAREKGVIDSATDRLMQSGDWRAVPAKSPYGDFLVFYGILEIQMRIDHEKLFHEIDVLSRDSAGLLSRTPEEKEYLTVRSHLDILEKLVSLRMTRNDIGYLHEHPDVVDLRPAVTFIMARDEGMSAQISTRLSPVPALDVAPAQAFYADALKRDGVLYDNAVKDMTKGNIQTAVVVMGGFHKEGMKERIKQEGYSYAVVTPRMTERYDDTLYTSLMLGHKNDFDRFLERVGTRLAPVLRTSEEMDPDAFQGLVRGFRIGTELCQGLREGQTKERDLGNGYKAVASLKNGEFSYSVAAVGVAEYGGIVARKLNTGVFGLSKAGVLDAKSRKNIEQMKYQQITDLILQSTRELSAKAQMAPGIARMIEQVRLYAIIEKEMRFPGADIVRLVRVVQNEGKKYFENNDLVADTGVPFIGSLIPVWCSRSLLRNKPAERDSVVPFLRSSYASYFQERGDHALSVDRGQAFRYYLQAVRFMLKSDPVLDSETVRLLSAMVRDIERTNMNDISSLLRKSRLYADIDTYLQKHLFDEFEMPALSRDLNQSIIEGVYRPILDNYESLCAAGRESGQFAALRDAGLGLVRFNSALTAAVKLKAFYGDVTKDDVDRYAALLKKQYRVLDGMLNKLRDQQDAEQIRSVRDIDAIFAEILILQSHVISLYQLYEARVMEGAKFDVRSTMMPKDLKDAYREGLQYTKRIREMERVAKISVEREAELKRLADAYEAERGKMPWNDFSALLKIGSLEYYYKNNPASAIAHFQAAFALVLEHPGLLAADPAHANQLFYYLKEAYYRNFLSHAGALTQLGVQEQLLNSALEKTPRGEVLKRSDLTRKLKENEVQRHSRELEMDCFRTDLIRINETALQFYQEHLFTDAGILYELFDLQLQIEKNLTLYDQSQLRLIKSFEEEVLPKTSAAYISRMEMIQKSLGDAKSGLTQDLTVLMGNLFKAKVEYQQMVNANLRLQLLREYDEKVKQVMKSDYNAAEKNLTELLVKLDRLLVSKDLSERFMNQFAEDSKILGVVTLPRKKGPNVQMTSGFDAASWRMQATASVGGLGLLLDAIVKKLYQFQMRAQEKEYIADGRYDVPSRAKNVAAQGHSIELFVGRDRVRNITGKSIRCNLDVEGLRPYYPPDATPDQIKQDFGAILQQGIEAREKIAGRHIYEGLYADKPYTVAVEDKSPDGVLFGNHMQDYFIFINKAVLEKLKDHKTERDDFIKVGVSHELRHEAKHRKLLRPLSSQELEDVEAALTAEDILLTETLKKKNLPAVVRFLDVFEEMFKPKETGAQYWYGLALRTVLLGGYPATGEVERLRALLNTVPPNTPLLPGAVTDVYRIVKPFVCSGNDVYGFGADKIDNKPKLIMWDFNKAGGGVRPMIIPFQGKTIPDQLLLDSSTAEKLLRAKQVAEILQTCSRNGSAVSLAGKSAMDFLKGFLLADKRAPLVYYQHKEGKKMPPEDAERLNLVVFRSVLSELINDPVERERSHYQQLSSLTDFGTVLKTFDNVSALAVVMRDRASEDARKAKETTFAAEISSLEGKSLLEVAAFMKTKKWGLNYRNELAKRLLDLIEKNGRHELAGAYFVVVPVYAEGDQHLRKLSRQGKISEEELAALREEVIAVKRGIGEIEISPKVKTTIPTPLAQLQLVSEVQPESDLPGGGAEAVDMPSQNLAISQQPAGMLGWLKSLLRISPSEVPVKFAAPTATAKKGVPDSAKGEIASFPASIAKQLGDKYYCPQGYRAQGLEFNTAQEMRAHVRSMSRGVQPVVFEADGKKISFTVSLDPSFAQVAPDVDMTAVLGEFFKIYKEWRPLEWYHHLQGLEGKEITIALLDRSQHPFEDHVGNGFIGINRAVFDAYKGMKDMLHINLGVGIFHELRHEATGRGLEIEDELANESVFFTMRLLAQYKIDITNYLADLQNLYAVDSLFFEKFIARSKVFDLSKRIFIGNERLYNLFIKYAGKDTIFISDCHLFEDPEENNKAIRTIFNKAIVTVDHHYDVPALRRETATSQMIDFLKKNGNPKTGETPFTVFTSLSYITSHVDPDSMLSYYVLKNWDFLRNREDMQMLLREAAYYADFGLLVKKDMPGSFAKKMQLFVNLLFGMQMSINRMKNDKENAFDRYCRRIPELVKQVHRLTEGEVAAIEESGTLTKDLNWYQAFYDNRQKELKYTSKKVNDAVRAGKYSYDEASGIIMIDIPGGGPAVYNANVLAYLRENGYFKDKKEPVAIIQGRAPPKGSPDAKGSYTISLVSKEKHEDMPSVGGLFAKLNAKEPQATKGWGGRSDAGGSHRTRGSSLSMEEVKDAVYTEIAAQVRPDYTKPGNYPLLARELCEPLTAYVDQLAVRDLILENIPREGDQRMISPDVATIALDGLLAADVATVEGFIKTVEQKYGAGVRLALLDRKEFITKYQAAKRDERVPDANDFLNDTYGMALFNQNPALYKKLIDTYTERMLTPEEVNTIADLVNRQTVNAFVGGLYGLKKKLTDLSPEMQRTIISPEFRVFVVSLALAAEKGMVVTFDKRNLFDKDGKTPVPGYQVYIDMIKYFNAYAARKNKESTAIVFDCKKDDKLLENAEVDAALKGITQVARTGKTVVDDIRQAVKVGADRWSLMVHQENYDQFRHLIGKLLSFLVFRFDGRVVDLSQDELNLIRAINPAIAEGLQAGTIDLIPPVTYDSTSFGKAQKAAIALELAA